MTTPTNALPRVSVTCRPAAPLSSPRGGDLLPSEESASLWLWGWPTLLGWRRPVAWLFSPVARNKDHPGDLWGLDDEGRLLIVETKADWGRKREDPLKDFVPYVEDPSARKFQTVAALEKRWSDLFEKELSFWEKDLRHFCDSEPLTGEYPGVVPYSRHRKALWQWRHVYEERIVPGFLSGEYEKAVRQALERRSAEENPPHFFGVIASGLRDPQLSAAGKQSLEKLAVSTGGRVFVRAIRASRVDDQVQLCAWSI